MYPFLLFFFFFSNSNQRCGGTHVFHHYSHSWSDFKPSCPQELQPPTFGKAQKCASPTSTRSAPSAPTTATASASPHTATRTATRTRNAIKQQSLKRTRKKIDVLCTSAYTNCDTVLLPFIFPRILISSFIKKVQLFFMDTIIFLFKWSEYPTGSNTRQYCRRRQSKLPITTTCHVFTSSNKQTNRCSKGYCSGRNNKDQRRQQFRVQKRPHKKQMHGVPLCFYNARSTSRCFEQFGTRNSIETGFLLPTPTPSSQKIQQHQCNT